MRTNFPRRLMSRRRQFETLEPRNMLSANGWAFSGGNPDLGDEDVAGLAFDSQENLYVAGRFAVSADLNGDGENDVVADSGEGEAFIAKYSPQRELLWVKALGNHPASGVSRVVVDAQDQVYVTIRAPEADNVFTKLASDGSIVYSRSIVGGTTADIALDSSGDVYVTGDFAGSVQFETNPGEPTVSLTSRGAGIDIFVAKYASDGTAVWATRAGAPDAADYGYAIDVDGTGNVYVAGTFNESSAGAADFGDDVFHVTMPSNAFKSNGTLKRGYNYKQDQFVSQLNAGTGQFNWTVGLSAQGGIKDEEKIYDLAVDAQGDVYISGQFDSNQIEFDAGTSLTKYDSDLYNDGFLAKLDPTGNFLWAESFGAPNVDDYGVPIWFDTAGRMYVGGMANAGAMLGAFEMPGTNQGFIAEVDKATGVAQSLLPIANDTGVWALTSGADGSLYSGGFLYATQNPTPFPTGELLISENRSDFFVMKLEAGAPSVQRLMASDSSVSAGTDVNLTVDGAFDAGGAINHIDFYLDSDGDGVLNASVDEWVATDNDATDAWDVTYPTTGLTAGDYTFLAQATDNDGLTSETVSTSVEIVDIPPTSDTQIYIQDIRFDSRRHDKDWRAVVEVRDVDGNAVAGVMLKVDFNGTTYNLTTDSNGIARTDWQRNLASGNYYADAYDLALADYFWTKFGLDMEDDSDFDLLPDDLLVV